MNVVITLKCLNASSAARIQPNTESEATCTKGQAFFCVAVR